MPNEMLDQIVTGDCREVLRSLPDNSFSCCVTDPPYNYEFIGRNWNEEEIDRRIARVRNSRTLVKNIPYGSGLAGGVRNERWYERGRDNIREYRDWSRSWALQLIRVMCPGAYCMVFNSTRTVAHIQVALEDAGFYARDILVYRRHAGIPKGLNVSKKLQAMNDPNWLSWKGWHSCLRNEWEAICLVQKPLIGNYIDTLKETGVGLLHAERSTESGFASNILEGFAREREKDGPSDIHCTVKPLPLIKYLIELAVPPTGSHSILDPFAGSGTTCLAAKELGHHFLGIELSKTYSEYANQRICVNRSALAPVVAEKKEKSNRNEKSLAAMLF
jgi:site-specific DNA-methyltransferase (adenine-specific)